MQAAPRYPGPSGGSIDARPRIGEWISEAFTLFGRDWLNWCLITLIYLFILSVPVAIGYTAIGVTLFAAMGIGAAAGGERGAGAGAAGALVGVMFGLFVMIVVILAVHAWLYAGMVRAAAKQLRGERIQVGDLFSGADVIAPAMIVEILQGLGVSIGMMLCVVPGYLLAGLWVFARPLVVERRMTPGEALRTSMDATKPYMWMYLLLFLLYSIVVSAGSVIGIGVIATFPIGHLMLMCAYRDVFGIPGAVPTVQQGMPGQPIGGYGAPGGYAPPPTNPGGPTPP
jgi:uncharacterized membrane protein